MDIQKSIKIEGPKYGRCKCINDYTISDTDIIYRKGGSYFYEYYRSVYKVYLADNRSASNINSKLFNLNFKKTHEKKVRRANSISKKSKTNNRRK